MAHESSRLTILSLIGATFVLSSYIVGHNCAPAIQSKNTWRDDNNVPVAVLGSACDPTTGRCWDLLPSEADARDNYIVEQNEFYDRPQPIHPRAASQSRDVVYTNSAGGVRNPSKTRHTKKDMFMSRGWGAGGMPFSVLFMHPRANHSSSSGLNQAETNKNSESSRKSHADQPAPTTTSTTTTTTTTGRPNPASNRLTLRNNNSGQPRRHFSILPHLFLSYGWGPSGK